MVRHIKSIEDVAAFQLCSGCGVCAYSEPERFAMVDTLEHGRRPVVRSGAPAESGEALAVCPGVELRQTARPSDPEGMQSTAEAWGPVLEVWEGYAADDEIRFSGSSGGAATALALYCLEHAGMSGVLHAAARRDVPYLNETVISRNRDDLLHAAGSRYAPASPCDGLAGVEDAAAPMVFIGKPCDVAAVVSVCQNNSKLAANIGVTIAFFCAGVPSTKGTIDLFGKAGITDPDRVGSVRYRGNGWPGAWTVQHTGAQGETQESRFTYEQSWGFLQKYRHWRCYICPDHSGEFADISVGDPWYRDIEPDAAGHSLIIARSRRGADIVQAAAAAGYLVLEREDKTLLPRSQPNLVAARGALWGRLAMLKLLGAPVPRFDGFPLLRFWWRLSLREKRSSLLGTLKRIFVKRLKRRIEIREWRP